MNHPCWTRENPMHIYTYQNRLSRNDQLLVTPRLDVRRATIVPLHSPLYAHSEYDSCILVLVEPTLTLKLKDQNTGLELAVSQNPHIEIQRCLRSDHRSPHSNDTPR